MLFATSENVSMMNNIKSLIQKEEYISLALNKYILQTGTIPKKADDTIDWDKLLVEEYLGTNFNKINPVTTKQIIVTFDSDNNAYIKGAIEKDADFKEAYNYLYNFYTNSVFRVNTLAPKDISKTELIKGSQVLYNEVQNNIVNIITENSKKVVPSNKSCDTASYYYELSNGKLIYKYCKSVDKSIEVYQDGPVYIEDIDELQYIKVPIGEKAYVKDGSSWYEYYYEGNSNWIPSGTGKTTAQINDNLTIEDRILSYIPDSKDLVLKDDGGCMLANGDIFCWGNNNYKKAGIETYGQLDTSIPPDYINTPVMLKVDIEDSTQKSKRWYNNPYRIKFEKMAMNNKNVCAISPIFDYYESGTRYKIGGDLYCNGTLHSDYFYLDTTGQIETSIMKKHKGIFSGKESKLYNENAIYLKDVEMVDGTIVLLSDAGNIYTIGSNDKGALGIANENTSLFTNILQRIFVDGVEFKKIYALRDIKGFGALDTQNFFWIWGERPSGVYYNKPTVLSNSKRFSEDGIFVNSKEFVLRGVDDIFYRTYSDISFKALKDVSGEVLKNAVSASVFDYENKELYLYVDTNLQLKGSSELVGCRTTDFSTCTSAENTLFNKGFDELNSLTNIVNNTTYANFSNASIFKSSIGKTVVEYADDYVEDFEDSSKAGWNVGFIYDGASVATKFLGLYGKNRINTNTGSQELYKTINLGSSWANKNVKITFDMYEIDSWDGNNPSYRGPNGLDESFFVYINDLNVSVDVYGVDSSYSVDTRDGVALGNIPGTSGWSDEKHTYSFSTTIDSTGTLKLGFGAILGEAYTNESFGIDNIRISQQIDNADFSSNTYLEDFEDENHDYWVVPRGPVPYTPTSGTDSEFYKYPIYIDSGEATKFLGRFGKKSYNGEIYHGFNNGTEEVYKVFSFGMQNANKQVQIDYDFYRIDDWQNNQDYFYVFINGVKTQKYEGNDPGGTDLKKVDNTSNKKDTKFSFTETTYLDEFGNIRLGFGAYFKYDYMETLSWGIDNVKFTLTGATNPSGGTTTSTSKVDIPYVCSMTGIGSSSQMYCWGNVGRSIPILSTSLYDVGKISTINKLFITKEDEKNNQMAFDNFNNSGNLFLKYPTYIGGFDYEFYFK